MGDPKDLDTYCYDFSLPTSHWSYPSHHPISLDLSYPIRLLLVTIINVLTHSPSFQFHQILYAYQLPFSSCINTCHFLVHNFSLFLLRIVTSQSLSPHRKPSELL